VIHTCASSLTVKAADSSKNKKDKRMANSNEYMREYMKQYSAKRRLRALGYLGGVCVSCGNQDGLEIHHIDPATKSFTLAKGWHHSWAKIISELDKCEILCDDCHKEHHKVDNEHGTPHRYWQGCRCEPCKKANTEYHKAMKK
jgi:hypothetical protein